MKLLWLLLAFFGVEAILIVSLYWDMIWSSHGLFWYHKRDDLGHMLAFLGYVYDVRIFGRHFSWRERK